MWAMVQQDEPDDYVVATGETHSVREVCEVAFARAGLNYEDHVHIDERFKRPAEVDFLVGNAAKAHERLGWMTHVEFAELIEMMVDADLDLLRRRVS
jgi:GDPmannose 4,6-dehydratase